MYHDSRAVGSGAARLAVPACATPEIFGSLYTPARVVGRAFLRVGAVRPSYEAVTGSADDWPHSETSADDLQTNDAERAIQEILDAIGDGDCRAGPDATSDEAVRANEISEIHDPPLWTAYRKRDLLTQAGLLDERARIRQSGNHASEYRRSVDEMVVSLNPREQTERRLSERKSPGQTGSPPLERRH